MVQIIGTRTTRAANKEAAAIIVKLRVVSIDKDANGALTEGGFDLISALRHDHVPRADLDVCLG